MKTTAKDLTGQRFGKLTVMLRATVQNKRAHWTCRCDCGQEAVKNGKYLLCGDTTSCGCEQRAMRAGGNPKYGSDAKSYKREYTIWRSMKSRCYTPSSSNYRFYGAKGVTVCERWFGSFSLFLQDMGPCPEDYTLDRINPHGNYEPSNCRWESWDVQHRNIRKRYAAT